MPGRITCAQTFRDLDEPTIVSSKSKPQSSPRFLSLGWVFWVNLGIFALSLGITVLQLQIPAWALHEKEYERKAAGNWGTVDCVDCEYNDP